MVKEVRIFRTLPVLDSILYDHFNVRIKQVFESFTEHTSTKVGSGKVMGRTYERSFPYRKEVLDGKRGRKNKRSAKAKRYGPYPIRHGITITMDKIARAGNASVGRGSAASFASRLVNLYKEYHTNVCGTRVRGSFRMQ